MQVTAVRWVLALGFGFGCAAPLWAQFGVARLSHADGAVTRLHRGAPAATTLGVSLMDGDQLATEDGRAEVTFLDGTIVHFDTHTRVIVNGNGRLQLLEGRVFLRTSGLKPYVSDTPAGTLRVLNASIAEITARADTRDVLLRVVSGSGRVECPTGNHVVNSYYSAMLSGTACHPMVTQWIPPQTDEFERWASLRTVMATSTPMSGTEFGDAVNWGWGWGYYGGYYPRPYYYSYYAQPVYTSPVVTSPYYSYGFGSTYYPSSSYYTGYSSYYNGYGSYYGGSPYREIYQWRVNPPQGHRDRPVVTPATPMQPAPPPRGGTAGIRPPS